MYAAYTRCPCGAGMAYARDGESGKPRGWWDCSAILLGTAVPNDQPGHVTHEAREHHARVRHCEARAYGVTTPCGTGTDATREHSHSIGKGMGGGKDYAASEGACAILCRKHHREVDERRADMRAAGLSIRAPIPDKVVPRRSDWNQPLFDDED